MDSLLYRVSVQRRTPSTQVPGNQYLSRHFDSQARASVYYMDTCELAKFIRADIFISLDKVGEDGLWEIVTFWDPAR